MIYYILLFISALIFSTQFLLTKQYQKHYENTFQNSLKLSYKAYFTIAVFFFIKAWITNGKFVFGFSWFTLGMTVCIAIVSISCLFFGIKVLSYGTMSTYSMFMMLGSLILPTFVGLIFYKENISAQKITAIAIMLVSIVLSATGGEKKINLKSILLYISVFVCNGLIGVFFTIHQNNPQLAAVNFIRDGVVYADNDIFMSWYGISIMLVSFVLLAFVSIKKHVMKEPKRIAIAQTGSSAALKNSMKILLISIPFLYGLCNGIGDYFIAVSTSPGALGSSVTYPIINGGTILFSSLIGFFTLKEKFNIKTIISLGLVLISTFIFMFAV